MRDADFLFVTAEVAVAFAGFASIVGVLGRRTTRDHPLIDAFRLRGLLECSLVVVCFSLLPYALIRSFPTELAAWRLSSALFAVAGGLSFLSIFKRRKLVEGIPVSLGLRGTIFLLYLLPLPTLLFISLGSAGEGGVGLYLLCLLSYLLAGGIGFFRVMVSFIAAVREE
jgi:hypothetical protein